MFDLRHTESIIEAARSTKRISGFTHDFYNYPARFSPLFAREVIRNFTNAGDLILDPFMGGGTTLVEAKLAERKAIGLDISSLSEFLTSVKLNPLRKHRLEFFNDWIVSNVYRLNCHRDSERPHDWIKRGYQRNLSNKKTWPIRKLMEQFLDKITKSDIEKSEKDFFRCLLLKTSQWALDSRIEVPSATEFKNRLLVNYEKMVQGSIEFWEHDSKHPIRTINSPAHKIANYIDHLEDCPKLVLTSPPYPGIHVLYHRWQIFGRKETPAPFWIANSQDGMGLSHYTMGNRQQNGLKDYFVNIEKSFSAICSICNRDTLFVQVLAFSDIGWQLPRYLKVMESAGLRELKPTEDRIWRNVPNRKWYAQQMGKTSGSKEVILFHRLT